MKRWKLNLLGILQTLHWLSQLVLNGLHVRKTLERKYFLVNLALNLISTFSFLLRRTSGAEKYFCKSEVWYQGCLLFSEENCLRLVALLTHTMSELLWWTMRQCTGDMRWAGRGGFIQLLLCLSGADGQGYGQTFQFWDKFHSTSGWVLGFHKGLFIYHIRQVFNYSVKRSHKEYSPPCLLTW